MTDPEQTSITDTPEVSRARMVWHSIPSGDDWGECQSCDLEFEDHAKFEQHRREKHPTSCSNWGCDRAARYSSVKSPHSYCPRCAVNYVDANIGAMRVNDEAEQQLPTLPDDHPIEKVIQGLEGSA